MRKLPWVVLMAALFVTACGNTTGITVPPDQQATLVIRPLVSGGGALRQATSVILRDLDRPENFIRVSTSGVSGSEGYAVMQVPAGRYGVEGFRGAAGVISGRTRISVGIAEKLAASRNDDERVSVVLRPGEVIFVGDPHLQFVRSSANNGRWWYQGLVGDADAARRALEAVQPGASERMITQRLPCALCPKGR